MDSSKYRPRMIDQRLKFYLSTFGAVCVEGPKWCGKTWTSQMQAKSVFMVGDPSNYFSNRELARLDVMKALEGDSPHLIDEWQEVTPIWDAVRFAVDQKGGVGHYILTGSSTPQLKGVMHSGTGRIASLPMHPMSLAESGDSACKVRLSDICSGKDIGVQNVGSSTPEKLIELVIRGGWPGALELSLEQAALTALEYVENIIRVDINRLDGIERDPVKVRKCLRSLARNESTTATIETIRGDITEYDDTTLSINTVNAYLGAFRRIFLTHDTEPFSTFLRAPSRIKQTPKRRFCDPSIAAALLGATPQMLLRDLRTFGFLFESLAVRDIEIYAEALGAKLFHYQDYDANEIDAVVQFPDAGWSAFEVKLNPQHVDEAAAGLIRLSDRFRHNPPKSLAVIVGCHGLAYRRPDGVYVVPLTALC